MKLVALKDAYKAEATTQGLPSVKTFFFDSMSRMNEPDQSVRIMLLKPAISVRQSDPNRDFIHYSIDYFLFDLVGDKQGEELATLWESIQDDVIAINKGIVNNNADIIEIVGDITFELGQHNHNADLAGVRSQYTLRVFDCLNP